MSDGGPRKIGVSIEVKPHAYDPVANPELFEGVLARRCIAFVVDVIIIAIPVVLAAVFIFIIGLVTLGLGWFLYWILSPAAVIWAICYYGLTFGSPWLVQRPSELHSSAALRASGTSRATTASPFATALMHRWRTYLSRRLARCRRMSMTAIVLEVPARRFSIDV